MGLSCLGSYHNVCTILGSFQSNGFANAPACARDEESASCQFPKGEGEVEGKEEGEQSKNCKSLIFNTL